MYEWIICSFNDAETKLKKMRENGWHPVSHSIWMDSCAQRMVSFLFRKKETEPTKDTSRKESSDNVLKFIKERVDELHH